MGGAPTAACEYTLAWCWATMSGLEVLRNCPPIGKTPYPLISAIPALCSSLMAHPPAPTKTNRALRDPGVLPTRWR